MRRIWVTVLLSGLLVCVLTGVTVMAQGARNPASTADGVNAASGVAATVERRDNKGLGPPPWAHAGGRSEARRGKAAQSWKDDWRALSPAQKEQRMAALSRAHREGMRKWARCVRDARAGSAERRGCLRPLPPGLAKKQP